MKRTMEGDPNQKRKMLITSSEEQLNMPSSQELSELIKCEICREFEEDFRTLPCGHDFCLNCLVGWLKSDQSCPKCRKKFESLKPKNLPKNLLRSQLSKSMRKVDNTPTPLDDFKPDAIPNCDECSNQATIFCVNCNVFLCDTHNIHASMKSLAFHQLQKAEEKSSFSTSKCSVHPAERVEFYCPKEQTLLCRDCIVAEDSIHRNHEYYKLGNLSKMKAEIVGFRQGLQDQKVVLEKELDLMKETSKFAIDHLEGQEQLVNADISKIEEEIKKHVDKLKERLVKERENKMKMFDGEINELKIHLEQVANAIAVTDKVKDMTDPSELSMSFFNVTSISKKVAKMDIMEKEMQQLTFDDEITQKLVRQLGEWATLKSSRLSFPREFDVNPLPPLIIPGMRVIIVLQHKTSSEKLEGTKWFLYLKNRDQPDAPEKKMLFNECSRGRFKAKWEATKGTYEVRFLLYDKFPHPSNPVIVDCFDNPKVVTRAVAKEGLRVVRGANWKWNDQDHGGPGVIEQVEDQWCTVRWDRGGSNNYRIGRNGKFDLFVEEPEPSASTAATTTSSTTAEASTSTSGSEKAESVASEDAKEEKKEGEEGKQEVAESMDTK